MKLSPQTKTLRRIVFRVDASEIIGTGHVMRCITLADALHNQGAECIFISRKQLGDLIFLIRERGYEVRELHWDKKLTSERPQQTIEAIGNEKIDWLIVDHYELDATWERGMRVACDKIMVLDDLADREHDCDVLLDQNLRENSYHRYRELIPKHCLLLTGPGHVLLNPQFNLSPLRQRNGDVKRILVYMGGNDITNQTGKAIKALQLIENIESIIVILGFSHPHRIAVFEMAHCDKRIKVFDSCQNMAEQMIQADLALGTCGIAAWERCAAGLPTIVAISAENQREDAVTLHELGAVENLGDVANLQTKDWLHAIRKNIASPRKLQHMGQVSQQIVAGHQVNMRTLIQHICNSHA